MTPDLNQHDLAAFALFLPSLALAEEKPPVPIPLNRETMKVGEVGKLSVRDDDLVFVAVSEVIGDNEMIVNVRHNGPITLRYIAKMPTKGLVDGKNLDRKISHGYWKVTDTKKQFGATYFVIEPYGGPVDVPPPPKPISFPLPSGVEPFPEVDPADPKPLLVREWSRAVKLKTELNSSHVERKCEFAEKRVLALR
ncbi:hypothetical protein [Zavarzinella formosa]|uniref:hypothetical protein n=1 Tax=Zavarzinella formosa TaxID=360055 RepID=UPI00037C678F|nr:hypothetical protein [Zavarzinella formosa]